MISDSIRDREFDSHGGGERPTTFKRVQDPYSKKLAELFELHLRGIDISTLNLLTDNDGLSLISNDGGLMYWQ